MRVFVMGSGSSGNGALVESDDGARILVDAGIGPRASAKRLRAMGIDLFPRGVDAIVLTHHHGDHIAHIEPLARALKAPIYMHSGIEADRVRRRHDVRAYEAGVPFRVGTLEVSAVSLPHDAPQMALRIAAASARAFGIATDLGHVPASLVALLADCDAALVEANHCPEMLATGPYPPRLKRRVGGDLGHLANAQTAELAAELARTRIQTLFLGHISLSNNTPELAASAVRARSGEIEIVAIPHGASRVFEVPDPRRHGARDASPRRAAQLALPLGDALARGLPSG